MPQKHTLDGFVQPSNPKRSRLSSPVEDHKGSLSSPKRSSEGPASNHPTYPFPIPQLPPHVDSALSEGPGAEAKEINDQPDLDLVYYAPFVPKSVARDLFEFLRESLFFYRVKYTIKRGPTETQINTPRYTTVFGIDTSCSFTPTGELISVVSKSPVSSSHYQTCKPRPIPSCLDKLRQITEIFTGTTYNFCLVNYYASGNDSISYHSDDEKFLGAEPAIASFSLGAKRDFLMKHKPPSEAGKTPAASSNKAAKAEPEKALKFPLASGDMVLMRGRTQANWLHSIPKRKGGEADHGRINITFRKALVKGGTENYYKYNVGSGQVYRWDRRAKEMVPASAK